MDAITQSIISRYNAEYAPEATNRVIPPATTLTIGINARDPWIPYLFRISGYCNTLSLPTSFLDARGVTRYAWTSWPDVKTDFFMAPLVSTYRLNEQGTYNSTTGNFFLVFANSTEENVELSLSMEMFLIDETLADSFEAEFKELYRNKASVDAVSAAGFSGPQVEELDWKKRVGSI
jgi:hypothetical protein